MLYISIDIDNCFPGFQGYKYLFRKKPQKVQCIYFLFDEYKCATSPPKGLSNIQLGWTCYQELGICGFLADKEYNSFYTPLQCSLTICCGSDYQNTYILSVSQGNYPQLLLSQYRHWLIGPSSIQCVVSGERVAWSDDTPICQCK